MCERGGMGKVVKDRRVTFRFAICAAVRGPVILGPYKKIGPVLKRGLPGKAMRG